MDLSTYLVRVILVLLLVPGPISVWCQQIEESLPQDQNPEHFDGEFWQQSNRLNINTCTLKDLMDLPWIKPHQANNLILFRQTFGPFRDLYQLQSIPGWDIQTIRNTLPLFKSLNESNSVSTPSDQKYIFIRWRPMLRRSEGYRTTSENGKFQGPPHNWLVRFRYQSQKRLDMGVLLDQDAGEKWRWSSETRQYGFDHISGFLQYYPKQKAINKVLVGDFQVHWDQGLMLGHGFNFSAPVITGVKKIHRGFYPHTSSQEHSFYRGVAAQLQFRKWVFDFFFSNRSPDARSVDSLEGSTYGSSKIITSQVLTGLHRNQGELAHRHQQQSLVMGLHLTSNIKKDLQLAFSYVCNKLKYPLVPTPRPYNNHFFRGRTNANWGLSLSYFNSVWHSFAQIAVSQSKGLAFQAGFLASLSPQWSLSGQIRWFDPRYHAVGSNTVIRNERGIYWGIAWQPKEQFKLSTSLDYSVNPQLAFNLYQPSIAWKARIQMQYLPRKNQNLTLNYQRRLYHRNQHDDKTSVFQIQSQHKDLLQLKGQWQNSSIQLRARVQASRLAGPEAESYGYLISSEIHKVGRLAITLGQAVFDTDDFANRQYHYERDLRFAFSLPGFQNKGNRWYVMTSCKISPRWQIWLRFAETIYENREAIGQGWDRIIGNRTSEFKAQILLKL